MSLLTYLIVRKGTKTMEKEYQPNEVAQKILDVLKDAAKPMSIADLSETLGFEVKPGNISPLVKKDYITSESVETVCPTCGHKTSHKVYTLK